MIKSVEIKNFESHKDTHLEFIQGVNIIYGESEQGKSAIFRAILWVITNRPLGSAFRSHWGGETSVKIETDDCFVSRITDKGNRYVLEYKDGRKFEFEAVAKQGVPIEISNALGIKPINIQTQFDNHFLLPPLSPGEIARQINQYIDLDIIDTTISNSTSSIKEIKRKLAALNTEAEARKIGLNEYSTLEDEEELLNNLEKLQRRIGITEDSITLLEETISKLDNIEFEFESYAFIPEAEEALERLELTNNRCILLTTEKVKIEEIIKQCKYIDENIKKLKDIGNKEELKKMEDLLTKIKSEEETENKLQENIQNVKEIIRKIKEIETNMNYLQKQIIQHMPEVCPFCGQRIPTGEKVCKSH